MGNNSNEYLEREPLDTEHQNLFGVEISNSQRRPQALATIITHFKFLKTAMLTRFPDYKPLPSASTLQTGTKLQLPKLAKGRRGIRSFDLANILTVPRPIARFLGDPIYFARSIGFDLFSDRKP